MSKAEREIMVKEIAALREALASEARSAAEARALAAPRRERMPDERSGPTRKFKLVHTGPTCLGCGKPGAVTELKFYLTGNRYADGRLGELFIRADRQGSFISGVLDALMTQISVGLQYGVPADVVARKLIGHCFDPSGFTGAPDYPSCKSVLDLIGQWIRAEFVAKTDDQDSGGTIPEDPDAL